MIEAFMIFIIGVFIGDFIGYTICTLANYKEYNELFTKYKELYERYDKVLKNYLEIRRGHEKDI